MNSKAAETSPIVTPGLDHEAMAAILHEANRQLSMTYGETPDLPWSDPALPEHCRESARNNITFSLDIGSFDPKDAHQRWMDNKLADGWRYGGMKSYEKKTHPCLLPWDQLSPLQKRKDIMWQRLLQALLGFLRETAD